MTYEDDYLIPPPDFYNHTSFRLRFCIIHNFYIFVKPYIHRWKKKTKWMAIAYTQHKLSTFLYIVYSVTIHSIISRIINSLILEWIVQYNNNSRHKQYYVANSLFSYKICIYLAMNERRNSENIWFNLRFNQVSDNCSNDSSYMKSAK